MQPSLTQCPPFGGKSSIEYDLKRDYSVDLKITIPAKGYCWYVIE